MLPKVSRSAGAEQRAGPRPLRDLPHLPPVPGRRGGLEMQDREAAGPAAGGGHPTARPRAPGEARGLSHKPRGGASSGGSPPGRDSGAHPAAPSPRLRMPRTRSGRSGRRLVSVCYASGTGHVATSACPGGRDRGRCSRGSDETTSTVPPWRPARRSPCTRVSPPWTRASAPPEPLSGRRHVCEAPGPSPFSSWTGEGKWPAPRRAAVTPAAPGRWV